ncbi:response regulator transcription factor [Sporolituus thermophilus]|uniref:DNA-binding response regulator, OmpR family, contains REC and winged-helix (WHTH) domain n=1 Tax=Sporolituus thermophilus DSM 23256 TaxID=1123285 RepID=A0A1G7K7C9_9FIRM|nr:response regulator transcription factor [Sporolituus thermophilus]SDF33218.1 DNA-binding response regulator, OmpR family, contains REC and winged-helix (wHTH) domain [Sporolituus thermophilus DSM 23256]
MRILLAEDDTRLGKLIRHMLEKEKMQVDWVTEGNAALEYALYSPYDVAILDWMMPGMSGLEVCDRLRKKGYQGAILMLTARDAVDDKVLGLDTGADDYLVKPFEFSELMARIRALSRRSVVALKEDIVQVGDLVLNRTTRVVRRGAREIQLTGREFQMLDLLVQNRGKVVPREVILDRVWGLESEVSSNNLDAYVRLLRKKIDFPGEEKLIHNIRGIGYKLGE